MYRSSVTCIVYSFTLWASLPFHTIAKEYRVGLQAGMQSGDFLYSLLNKLCIIQCNFITGTHLSTIRKEFQDLILENKEKKVQVAKGIALVWHLQIVVLQEGEHCLDDEHVDHLPGSRNILEGTEDVVNKGDKVDLTVPLLIKMLRIQRLFFFRRLDGISFGQNNILEVIVKEKHPLRPFHLMSIFFQGLAAFQLARQTDNDTRNEWIKCGESVLAKLTCWKSTWNFENKILLLQAEQMYASGQFDQAKDFYTRSIQSARIHRFITEEAIASELAGDLFYEKNDLPKSLDLFKHSIRCFEEWGAFAVTRRIESSVCSKFGLESFQLDTLDDSLVLDFSSHQDSSKRERE